MEDFLIGFERPEYQKVVLESLRLNIAKILTLITMVAFFAIRGLFLFHFENKDTRPPFILYFLMMIEVYSVYHYPLGVLFLLMIIGVAWNVSQYIEWKK